MPPDRDLTTTPDGVLPTMSVPPTAMLPSRRPASTLPAATLPLAAPAASTATVEPSPATPDVPPAPPQPTAPATATPDALPTPGLTPTPGEVAPAAAPNTGTMPLAVGAAGVVLPTRVNLREGPGATYPIRWSYPRNTRVQALGKDRSGAWLRVVMPDERAGWMATSLVRLAAPLASLPLVDGNPAGEADGAAASAASAPVAALPAGGVPEDSGVDTKAAAVPNISDAPEGLGVVIVPQTSLHIAPGSRTEVVQTLRADEQVKLFGQAKGAWVRVQPFSAVVPGWVYAAHLRPLPGAIAGAPVITATATLSITATSAPMVGTAPGTATPPPMPTRAPAVVQALPEPATEEPAPPLPPRVPVAITVDVVEASAAPPERRRGATPTPAARRGVAGLRVELVTAVVDGLGEAVTPATGRVSVTRDVPADTALFVQVPALGLRTQLPPPEVAVGTTAVTIVVPPVKP